MESEFFERNGKKNWKLFANVACLDGSKLKKHRKHKGLLKKVKLSDYYHSTFYTWASLDDLKEMKKSAKSLMERGFDMLPEGVEKKKTVPRGMWNIINEGRHAICPMDNCGQVQRTSKLGQHHSTTKPTVWDQSFARSGAARRTTSVGRLCLARTSRAMLPCTPPPTTRCSG